jgi:RimJ/RimL family protein N-acetyltransferase
LAEVSVAVIYLTTSCWRHRCARGWDRQVLISYVITEPAWKGRGLGTAAVAESIRLIHERSGVDVFTEVTDGNVVSERLLTAVGFARLDSV